MQFQATEDELPWGYTWSQLVLQGFRFFCANLVLHGNVQPWSSLVANASQGLQAVSNTFNVMRGCSFEAGTTAINTLIPSGNHSFGLLCEACDWSAGAQGMNLFNSTSSRETVIFRNCKLPPGWNGALNASTTGRISKFAMHHCDAGDTNYRLETEARHGNVYSETTLVRTGGASDGTTGLSWKMVSGGDAEYPEQYLESPEIVQWVDSTGSKTFTIEILHDSATNLKDDEVWMELMYLGTSGVPLGSIASDAKTGWLTTASDQTDSSATWTTTGMSNPNTQKINVTATVNEKGFVHAMVRLAKDFVAKATGAPMFNRVHEEYTRI